MAINIQKIADSGQCFRIRKISENRFIAIAKDKYCEIDNSGAVLCSNGYFSGFWDNYFDLNTDYNAFPASIDKTDLFLTSAAEFGNGIRILNQDPWEMLITFIISQRKNIPAITAAVEKISKKFGHLIGTSSDGVEIYSFPSPEELSKAGLEDLRECSLGYRAEYVKRAANQVALGEVDLEAMRNLSNEELFDKLLSFYGVGKKVANCVMLFGYHRIDAFPIDVWIQRVLDQYYDGNFPLEKYQGYAGVLQQYMFYYIRNL